MQVRSIAVFVLFWTVLGACSDDRQTIEGKDSLSIVPPTASVAAGGSRTFSLITSAGAPLDASWAVAEPGGGSIDGEGFYTAPEIAGTYTIVATAPGFPGERPTAVVTVRMKEPDSIRIAIEPSTCDVSVGGVLRFASTVTGTDDHRVVWSVVEPEGGRIDAEGVYTAPEMTGTFTVRARSLADAKAVAEAEVTVVEGVAVAVSPAQARVRVGRSYQFSATVTGTETLDVVWSIEPEAGGSITAEGRYTAPSTPGIFTIVATSVADAAAKGTVRVVVEPAIEVVVEPAVSSVEFGNVIAFSAAVRNADDPRVTWSVGEDDGGVIGADGSYVAPAREGTFHVVATSVEDPSSAGTAVVVVRPLVAIAVEPAFAQLEFGAEQLFAAIVTGTEDRRAAWSVTEPSGGTIGQNGAYLAPTSVGVFHVVATSVADSRRIAIAEVRIVEPVAVEIAPATASIEVGGTIAFDASVSGTTDQRVAWAVVEPDGGSIASNGTYLAPASPGLFHVEATSVADPRRTARAEVTVRPPVAVSVLPAAVTLEYGESTALTATVTGAANQAVTWSVQESGGGTIDASGTYLAPAAAGSFHVVATSVADPRRSAFALMTVRAPIAVQVLPIWIELEPGDVAQFQALVTNTTNTAVTWNVVEPDGGTVDANGLYTAPEIEGAFGVQATSLADPRRNDSGTAVVVAGAIDLSALPADRRTTWNPGIPGGIPQGRVVHTTLTGLATDGTGDAATAINQAILNAHAAYLATGTLQEVVLPAGTFRTAGAITLNRSGVILRGQGPNLTRIRHDGSGDAIRLARNPYGTFTSADGPWFLASDAAKGDREIVLANTDAAGILVGDILCIDEEDDPTFVRMGDARYEKRQPSGDTHGPALRGAGLWRSVTSMIRVTGKSVGASHTTLSLADPLHMNFRTSRYAQVFEIASESRSGRSNVEGVHWLGVEDLYITGGTISTNNVAFCWLKNLEVDGNPGTPNVGTYNGPGGISGRSVNLFHAYRCELRDSYVHHSRSISQGGGAYLVSLSSYTSESLVENNIVVFGNKPVVGNMMGGGNVIAYNYVDNARTSHVSWQEGAIDLNHQAFTHNALVEGNWATNITSDTTHGNAGWHVFFRNFATGQNSAPLYGPYPYTSAPDGTYRRAAGVDGYHRESTYVGNVLLAGSGTPRLQVDHTTGALTTAAAVWRIGWGVDGGGTNVDNGTALALLYRHGNWDPVTNGVTWDAANPVHALPGSLYLRAKPAFFGTAEWPWVVPTASTTAGRVLVLPAKARWDAMTAP